ncbi:30S ribosomal protein S21 [Candidatus Nomurabacteria bacterium]|uniref:Small ribosomal subunit protein bS21 n=1 Tax=candidate division WWE3 bacterium TaxID=2053526 RepID=A0A955DZR8_UNCKA|nr:30S ribosomal protein S21 [candidate division WWE3 bacterium]MCB9823661.1 30S ribosomal protein S21 [Candidatus Nomurabacteria bacterium]MCB9827261.1 30S ribosomal protein S21 [Candidatus Nomurabacteria bacterium]MCB9827456.1 30S ribosomal protein S21 [Candidatus Nomurabacteria bacterium]HXK52869.1 30S ribosomal protein S21 [bacterium]
MAKIKVRNNESLEQALRRFNREVLKAGIIREINNRRHYRKPSEIKAEKVKEKNRKIMFEKRKNS